MAPWIASLGPSGACGRAVWRLLGGPGDPLGGLWERSWGGLGKVLGGGDGHLGGLGRVLGGSRAADCALRD